MHILYIHQHFAVPGGSTGTRSYEFARRWVNKGHRVTVITGRYDVGGLRFSGGFLQNQLIDGIHVVIVGIRYGNRQSSLRRVLSFLCFVILSVYAGLRVEQVDLIYATSTPLTVGIPAMVLKRLMHVPFIFEVRDQWPEIPIDMRIIRNRFLIRILLWLERTIYHQSAAIVALSPGMAEGIRSVIGKEKKIAVIPNSSDTEIFRPDIDGSAIRKERGWDKKLVFMHFGAIGKANGLNFLIDAASMLRCYRDIRFVVVGDGGEKLLLIERAKSERLENVEFSGSLVKTELASLVAACDVSLVIFANYPILEHNSANKFFDSLSAGKPVLLNYSGWQRKILEDNAAGFGCALCSLDEFVEKVLYFDSHRQELAQMGRNARSLAVEKFDRDKLAMQALQEIVSIKT